ncbi:uncharacterized protein LOC144918812 [Branchiostoma floridae x Branchiostoma belcheri]|nr:hypothetical protein Bbelb_045930 [Branchiostoma belcheri]
MGDEQQQNAGLDELGENYTGWLARRLGYDWKLLAFELGFTRQDLSAIEKKIPGSVRSRCAEMFRQWEEQVPELHDKVVILRRAFVGIQRGELADDLYQRYTQIPPWLNRYQENNNWNTRTFPPKPKDDIRLFLTEITVNQSDQDANK